MAKVKIDPKQLFEGKNNIRDYLSVGISDYAMSEIIKEWEIDSSTIEELIGCADIYVQLDMLPEYIEVKELEK